MGGSVPTGVSPRVSGSHGYQYILVVGAFAAFLFGWGTGSNDVANAFGTSVGSGALTLNQAIGIVSISSIQLSLSYLLKTFSSRFSNLLWNLILYWILKAAIFEFLGAMVLGRVSTSVIASGIANGKVFASQPFAYSYGMMWTLMLGGIWQGWASKNGFNVSATHSIIGGIF
jgi:sodium-dependent phosphate transporter